jgi:hypothetical protein
MQRFRIRVLLFAIFTFCSAACKPRDSKSKLLESDVLDHQSLFETLVTGMPDGSVIYPFDDLVSYLESIGGPAVQVLVPIGRSLQKKEAKPDYFKFPRRIIGFVENPFHKLGHGENFNQKLYLGFSDAGDQIEVISYDRSANQFSFLLVKDYSEGKKPHLVVPNRETCTVCHQSGLPIFSQDPWEDSNSTGFEISNLLLKHHPSGKIGKFLVEGPSVNAYPGGIDQFQFDFGNIRLAPILLESQERWRNSCKGNEDSKLACRGSALSYLVQNSFGENQSISAVWKEKYTTVKPLSSMNPLEVAKEYQETLDLTKKESFVKLPIEEQLAVAVLENSLPSEHDPKKLRPFVSLNGEPGLDIAEKHRYHLAKIHSLQPDGSKFLSFVFSAMVLDSKLKRLNPFGAPARITYRTDGEQGSLRGPEELIAKMECAKKEENYSCDLTDLKNTFKGTMVFDLNSDKWLKGSSINFGGERIPLACRTFKTEGGTLSMQSIDLRCSTFDFSKWRQSWAEFVKSQETNFNGALHADYFDPDNLFQEYLQKHGVIFDFKSRLAAPSSVKLTRENIEIARFKSVGMNTLVTNCHRCHGMPGISIEPAFLEGKGKEQICQSLSNHKERLLSYLGNKNGVEMPPDEQQRIEFFKKDYGVVVAFLRSKELCE